MTVIRPDLDADIPAGLTDEALRSSTTPYARDVANLLTIPAEYRRPVEAEVGARRYRPVSYRRFDRNPTREEVADPREVRRRVVAEVWAQLAQEVGR